MKRDTFRETIATQAPVEVGPKRLTEVVEEDGEGEGEPENLRMT